MGYIGYIGIILGYIGIMEKKMDTLLLSVESYDRSNSTQVDQTPR